MYMRRCGRKGEKDGGLERERRIHLWFVWGRYYGGGQEVPSRTVLCRGRQTRYVDKVTMYLLLLCRCVLHPPRMPWFDICGTVLGSGGNVPSKSVLGMYPGIYCDGKNGRGRERN